MKSRVVKSFLKAFEDLPESVQQQARAALGIRDGDEIVWFWIGSHAEYDRLIERL
jgi:hypothetical protein